MTGGINTTSQQGSEKNWVMELLVPGLFSLILIACLVHMATCALQGQGQPVAGFEYAISAFAL